MADADDPWVHLPDSRYRFLDWDFVIIVNNGIDEHVLGCTETDVRQLVDLPDDEARDELLESWRPVNGPEETNHAV